jgi:hypothetical protein
MALPPFGRRLIAAATCVAALAVFTVQEPASAEPAGTPDGDAPTHLEVTMKRVPIVSRGTAQPDGTTSVVLESGVTISVQTESLAKMDATTKIRPLGSVWGDCGMSYIDLYRKDNGEPAKILTGFKVFDSAVEYHWVALIRGQQNYRHVEEWGGPLWARKTWQGEWSSFWNERHGHWQAWVEQPSFAVTTDGICVSGDPVAVRDL